MYSYIALTWETREGDGEQAQAAGSMRKQLQSLPDFEMVLSGPGICIVQKAGLLSACDACRLNGDSGVIVGTLFTWPAANEPSQRRTTLTATETDSIVTSRSQHLISNFWGRYVAFVKVPRTARYVVMRDPAGMLPCFHTSHRGVHIWFSRLTDLSSLGLPNAQIDWRYVEKRAVTRGFRAHDTGLSGIQEVLAGESWEVDGNAIARKILWDASAICETDVIEDSASAAEQLRSVTKACVDTWASVYNGILHTLSGGLDSSIVAVLLGQTPTRTPVTCANYFTADAEGDERDYARLVAQKAGFKLIERRRSPRSVDLRSIRNITPTPNPWVYAYSIEHADYEHEQAHLHGASAVFSGGGGDGVFYETRAEFSVADYLQRHGLTSRLPGIALDAARLEGKSLLSILWSAFAGRQKHSRRKMATEHAKQQTLVSASAIASQSTLLEASFDESARGDVPAGKWWQILSIAIPPGFYDQFDSPLAIERVAPIVSQPIVELCLRIPTYVLVENGWNRAIARRAFESDLPRAIVNRRGKGGLENHARLVFNANIKFIREFLLDGELARRGILNREHLEHCLSGGSVDGPEFIEIQDHLSTEAWVQSHRNA